MRSCVRVGTHSGLCICLFAGLMSAAWAQAADLPFIEVDPQSVAALREQGTGRPFMAVGLNYFGPHMGWAPKLWQQFDATTVCEHLDLIKEQGFNTVRVFLTLDAFHREPGQLHAEGVERFREFLALCRERGLYVIPAGPDHWEGVPEWRRDADAFADEAVLAADERWWSAFAEQFKDEPGILAYDLLNEPTVQWSTPAMRTKWNAWLSKEYGADARIAEAWGCSVDEVKVSGVVRVPSAKSALNDTRLYDYQRFRETVGEEWMARMCSAIRSRDRNHLITVGHIQWASAVYLPGLSHYAGFTRQADKKHLDLLTLHFYPLAQPTPSEGMRGVEANAIYLEALLHEFSVGKPLMIGEFAWYGGGELRVDDRVVMPEQSPEEQARWCAKLLEVSEGRVCGWLHWAFADTPSSRDLTRWSGLWTEDLQIKPWGRLYGEFARRVLTQRPASSPFSADLAAFEFDRKALLTSSLTGNRYLAELAAGRKTP